MKKLYYILIIIISTFVGGCNSQAVSEDITLAESYEISNIHPTHVSTEEIRQYYAGLNAIGDSIEKELPDKTRGDFEALTVIGDDVKGAIYGAKLGWKWGNGFLEKLGLSTIMAAVMGAVFSAVSAIVLGICSDDYSIKTENGDISYISDYEYEYIENKALQSALNSYAYHCADLILKNQDNLNNLNFDFSELSNIDGYLLLNDIPILSVYDSERDTTISYRSDNIANIHNDVLKHLFSEQNLEINVDEILCKFDFLSLKSIPFYNKMDTVTYCFKEGCTEMIETEGFKQVDLIPSPILIPDQHEIINNTVLSYINEINSITKREPENCDYFINRLANQYISYISQQPFIYDYNKSMIYSAIIVGVYSCQFWKNDSGMIY